MPLRPSEEELEKVFSKIEQLINRLEPTDRRDRVLKMMDGPVGQSYYLAPASSREEFHSCFPGGLAYHSLNVVLGLKRLTEAMAPGRWNLSTLALVGLFHDLGKVGDGKQEMYVPNPSDWHRNHGMLYEINKDCVFMPTSERGLFILQKHGIELSSEEYLAIRLNDGMYDDTNKSYRMKEPDLALLLHWADRWSASQEKVGVETKGPPSST